MSTVFIGGSRQISRLPGAARERLDNVLRSNFYVLVGDANGADKAVQRYLHEAGYNSVVVYFSGEAPRNNVGSWPTVAVKTPKGLKGFQFYAAKDREMADAADFGLMIWDGKSAGTVLNVLRLVRAGKKAVLLNAPAKETLNFKATSDWDKFLASCSVELRADLAERATEAEWSPEKARLQSSLFDGPQPVQPTIGIKEINDEFAAAINMALAEGNTASVVSTLGQIAKAQGMSHVAKDAGLARESLYRSLSAEGNPEFATVVKVMESVGLRLTVTRAP